MAFQIKHDARDFSHPFPGGQISQQTSPEHVIHGPVAAFVDEVALWVVRRGKNSLNSQCAGYFPRLRQQTPGHGPIEGGEVCQSMARHGATEHHSLFRLCDCWRALG